MTIDPKCVTVSNDRYRVTGIIPASERGLRVSITPSSQFETVYFDGKPIATIQRRRVLDKASPVWTAYATDGRKIGTGENGSEIRRVLREWHAEKSAVEETAPKRRKSTGDIFDQWARIDRLLAANQRAACKRAHPETDGNIGLVHNWGNDAARAARARYDARAQAYRAIYERLYHATEHAQKHGDHFRPLWCPQCRLIELGATEIQTVNYDGYRFSDFYARRDSLATGWVVMGRNSEKYGRNANDGKGSYVMVCASRGRGRKGLHRGWTTKRDAESVAAAMNKLAARGTL
jgi:hypothetical protein